MKAKNIEVLVTLGPASLSEDVVSKCVALGVTIFRINLSHTSLDDLESTITKIRSWTDVPICLDSEGAQLRNQVMSGGEIYFDTGDDIRIPFSPVTGSKTEISFTPTKMASQFQPGDRIRIDFDGAEFEVNHKMADHCLATVIKPGFVGSNKAADLNRPIEFDPLTTKDVAAIEIGHTCGIKNFALSFTNRPQDVIQMRAACGLDANIICKIESKEGVRNLDAILDEADAILIDRGDLSRQIELQKIPAFQRRIISTANGRGKPVYVATNLLESMIQKASPSRAEVNDVVSTLMMGADGLVLAAETAIGKYPVQAVEMIRLLIDEATTWDPEASLEDLLDEPLCRPSSQ
ncbi:MAG: pyruvate kinase [Rhodospirillales bacterium]|nr:pyruvate kinase [Rhodospirillales bacterium]